MGLGDPANLPLYLSNEGFDPLRCGLGLLTLDLDRGAAVLLVHEVEVERGVYDQNATNEAHEQYDVLEKEAPLHSMTSSTRARKSGGKSMPSALAVFWFTTSSKRDDC